MCVISLHLKRDVLCSADASCSFQKMTFAFPGSSFKKKKAKKKIQKLDVSLLHFHINSIKTAVC